MSDTGAWVALALLGAFHGLNPAMGWLFAVALGLQERSRTAVLRALPPIVLGHTVSVAVVVVVVGAAQLVIPTAWVRALGASVVLAFGLYTLARRSGHPRWVGMRVGFRDLTLWSFLMASAHGAGVMLVPVLLQLPTASARSLAVTPRAHAPHVDAMGSTTAVGLAAVAVHTAALFAVMGTVAVLVFEVFGVEMLRRAWINLDLLWSTVLIAAGVVTLLIG